MVWGSHAVGVNVDDLAVFPVDQPALGVGRHGLAVAGEALAVERGLNEPALAEPGTALGEQEALAEQGSKQAGAGTLHEVPASRHQDFLDGVRMVEQKRAAGAEPHRHDVAVVVRTGSVEGKLITLKVSEASEEEVSLRTPWHRRDAHSMVSRPALILVPGCLKRCRR